MAAKTQRKAQLERTAITVAVNGLPAPIELIGLHRLRTNGGTQMRAGLDVETVAEYTDALRTQGGWPFPPVVGYYDGTNIWLADGFHRVEAAHTLMRSQNRPDGLYLVPTICHAGDRRQAILHAAGANSDHGLRRTNADKRRAVLTLLKDEEWSAWSDNEIAKRCHVSQTLVSQIHRSLSIKLSDDAPTEAPAASAQKRTYTTKHGTVAEMDTSNIGKKPTPASPAAQATPAIPVPPPLTLDQTMAWLWERIKAACMPDPAIRLVWLHDHRGELHALPGAKRTILANLHAAADRIERELEGKIEHDRRTDLKRQAQEPKPVAGNDKPARVAAWITRLTALKRDLPEIPELTGLHVEVNQLRRQIEQILQNLEGNRAS